MTERTEAMLVLLAQSGDQDALGELLAAVQPALRGYLRVLTRDDARADDVLQETFVLVVRKLRTLRDVGLFRPWLLFLSTLGVFYAIALGAASPTLRLEDCTRRSVTAVSLLTRDGPDPDVTWLCESNRADAGS